MAEYNTTIWKDDYRNRIEDFYSLISESRELFDSNVYLKPSESDIEPITFKRLYEFVKCFGDYLSSLNVKESDKIAVLLPNSSLLVLLFLSIISNSRVFVPINVKCSMKEIDYILDDSGSILLIYSDSQKEKIKGISSLAKKISVTNYAKFIKDIFSITCATSFKKAELGESFDAEIVYTSGTTGYPKGVLLTQKNLLEDSFCVGRLFNFCKNDNFLTVSPVVHNSGQIVTTLIPLWCGGRTTVVRSDMGLLQFWSYVDRFDINWSLGMPAHINFLVEGKNQPKKSTLKGIFCGGAKLDINRQIEFEKRFLVPIINNYGLTETTSIATCDSLILEKRVLGSVGKPLYINEVKIFKDGKEVSAHEVGEIRIKGSNIFKAYVNKLEVTSQKLKNGWVHTGDLGYKDEDGNFFILDRVDNIINIGGEKVYPSEIENLIPRLEGVKDGVLSSIPHKILGNELVFLFEAKDNSIIEISAWKNIFIQHLSSFKIPSRYINIEDLGMEKIPRAENGKFLRQKIKELLKQRLIF